MDRPQAGSLPPSAFVLMTLYYLQQCQPPVLPVLQARAGGLAEDDTADQLDLGRRGRRIDGGHWGSLVKGWV